MGLLRNSEPDQIMCLSQLLKLTQAEIAEDHPQMGKLKGTGGQPTTGGPPPTEAPPVNIKRPDGTPLVEVARKMKAIEGMQSQINDMERRLGIMQSVEPVLENAIKTLQKVVDVRGMGKK